MSMIQEFKSFALKGNVMDLAVGVIIGGAFSTIVNSIVKDLIMPVVGLVTGGLDFSRLVQGFADGGCRRVRLWLVHYRADQLHHPGVHHFPDGQVHQQVAQGRGAGTTARGNAGRRAVAA